MSFTLIPIGILFVTTIILVLASIEAGYRVGKASHTRSEGEKETPVGAMAGAILGLGAFMLAFTFGIVSNRFDARKELVREEASALRTAWRRADFLPDGDREEAKTVLRGYLDDRVESVLSGNMDQVSEALTRATKAQERLWVMAVANARKDMNSDVAALYVESLDEMTTVHAMRVAVGLQVRIPSGIWMTLLGIIVLGMMAVGYQTGVAGSERSMARLILAVSFALVIELIAALDRPDSWLIPVSQQPLVDVRTIMDGELAAKE